MAKVVFEKATRIYPGTQTPAVSSLDLEIEDGEFMVLVGPSGSGKTTALRMLAGLEAVDEGRIYIGDRDVTDVQPKDRDIAMVFQNYALYPHMTVAENIGFHLKIKKRPKAEIRQRVLEAARLLDLEPYLDRKPARLSGGQRQRVAMGRAIVRQPQVFLMDEPLSNLDAKLRVATRTQIASLQRRLGVTTVYVTHDQVEAMTMGDRVAVLRDGLLQQCDTPRVLFDRPVNVFVAGFIGSPAMNLIDVPVTEAGAQFANRTVPLTPTQRAALTGNSVTLGVRPEGWEIVSPTEGVRGVVELVEELGSDSYAYVTPEYDPNRTIIVRPTGGTATPHKGDQIGLTPRPHAVHLFDTATGLRLPD
ncbi:carbohydrate ABC transporter ATP-binding protein, CUT1 family [Acidothermus cellulolyticus 11B]|uniref:Carbohydrate ABC transporter ATP-binding protein, CUT1 family n=1 Tax=Acidothermus cellulolyticus (strain ATCC 43068 / DSM 8971 / 11B) TaxID=351607 RepID=A0LSC1_ACIC1|nr:sn-glycerol-3-phosphate ABC transporter ATP-binding protein UgpC [Acidothermus cellulolyticus]ABK52331.1 carbohydrate ABC transporter ATP-binding protein, CUT1 family [Acidothermus cellulolyticus 11B]